MSEYPPQTYCISASDPSVAAGSIASVGLSEGVAGFVFELLGITGADGSGAEVVDGSAGGSTLELADDSTGDGLAAGLEGSLSFVLGGGITGADSVELVAGFGGLLVGGGFSLNEGIRGAGCVVSELVGAASAGGSASVGAAS